MNVGEAFGASSASAVSARLVSAPTAASAYAVVATFVELSDAAWVVVVGEPGRFTELAIVGFGYVPASDPAAAPLGGSAVGIWPKAAASEDADPFVSPVILCDPIAITPVIVPPTSGRDAASAFV
jgi:hypothetical protein